MRTKNIFSWVASLALCFLMLTACGSVEEKADPEDPATAASQATTSNTTANDPSNFPKEVTNESSDNSRDSKSEMVETDLVNDALAENGSTDKVKNVYSSCKVIFADAQEQTVKVDLEADRDCTLVVAIYDQDEEKMLFSEMSKVRSGDTVSEVYFKEELPDVYVISAYLVDSADNSPLCNAFSSHISNHDIKDAEKYYKETSEIIEIKDVTPQDMFSESEIIDFLKEKGFSDISIVYEYSASGDYIEEHEVEVGSNDKHPTFKATYTTKDGNYWLLDMIGKNIMATPISYIYEKELSVPVVLSENEYIYSFFSKSNTYFVTTPHDDVMNLKRLEKIDRATLDALTSEELDKL